LEHLSNKELFMARSRSVASTGALLRVTLGIFFVILGISGIIPQTGEGFFSLSRGHTSLEIVFGIVELACGLFLIYDAIRPVAAKVSGVFLLVIIIAWIARVVMVEFLDGVVINKSGLLFRPDFWTWALAVSTDLVILSGLWVLFKSE